MILIEKERPANFVEYHSNKISRVARSSMAAGSCAMTSAAAKQLYTRLLYGAPRYGILDAPHNWRERLSAGGILVTDAKSFYDQCHKTGRLAQKRQTALDLLMTKDMIEAQTISMTWVPTFRQLADSLTKEMADVLLKQFKQRNYAEFFFSPVYRTGRKTGGELSQHQDGPEEAPLCFNVETFMFASNA